MNIENVLRKIVVDCEGVCAFCFFFSPAKACFPGSGLKLRPIR